MNTDWDQRYQQGDTPWDSGRPCPELVRVLDEHAIPPGRALELGCGTGINSIYLASRGFDVIGVDISPAAISAAEKAKAEAGMMGRFVMADVFRLPDLGAPFPFIFDRGCYHVVRQIDEAAIVEVFDRNLAPGGHLLVLAGNAKEQPQQGDGPPRVSEEELRRAFEGRFDIRHLREFRFDTQPGRDFRPLAWSLLLQKRR